MRVGHRAGDNGLEGRAQGREQNGWVQDKGQETGGSSRRKGDRDQKGGDKRRGQWTGENFIGRGLRTGGRPCREEGKRRESRAREKRQGTEGKGGQKDRGKVGIALNRKVGHRKRDRE
jgi:hypothetical protein